MCEENWVDVTNERLENTFLIPVCLSRPSQQTIEYRLLRPTPPPAKEGKGPSVPHCNHCSCYALATVHTSHVFYELAEDPLPMMWAGDLKSINLTEKHQLM
ncbi:hypothetical protein CDAR_616911 [Caerostris darwini]|uniref:Uncharacterized protein n=1 Tax=Caerostris darwini TaxID=1538125 RepID=A0AAV4RZ82_9ARAC|nr:hypothetical protein CDAR_616911 [Caerostris darwini]